MKERVGRTTDLDSGLIFPSILKPIFINLKENTCSFQLQLKHGIAEHISIIGRPSVMAESTLRNTLNNS